MFSFLKGILSPTLHAAYPKKWSWTSEAVDIFLKYIAEFKTKCEFNGEDFEADLSTTYAEIR